MARNYVVKKGDSLWKIAQQQLGNPKLWKTIAEANHMHEPYLLIIGRTLILPSHSTMPNVPSVASVVRRAATVDATLGPMKDIGTKLEAIDIGSPPSTEAQKPQQAKPGPTNQQPGWLKRTLDELAQQLARPMKYPIFDIKLDDLDLKPATVFYMPGYTVTVKLKGSLTIQRDGTLGEIKFTNKGATVKLEGKNTEMEISNHELTATLKAESESAFGSFITSSSLKFDEVTGHISLSWEYSSTVKIDGRTLYAEKLELTFPGGLRFTHEASPINAQFHGYTIKGTLGFVVDIERHIDWNKVFVFGFSLVLMVTPWGRVLRYLIPVGATAGAVGPSIGPVTYEEGMETML